MGSQRDRLEAKDSRFTSRQIPGQSNGISPAKRRTETTLGHSLNQGKVRTIPTVKRIAGWPEPSGSRCDGVPLPGFWRLFLKQADTPGPGR